MNILVNFSGKNFETSRLKLNASATKAGVDKTCSFDDQFIKHMQFYEEHQDILDAPVGAGYWLWKPYLILQVMNEARDGDVVFYSDAGIEITSDLSPLTDICLRNDFLLFRNAYTTNKLVTKRDCFVLMDSDSDKYWNGPHLDASFCVFKNSSHTRNFVKEWLSYCCDARILTDQPNQMGKSNFWGHRFHRHDQSVLSLLAIRYGLELFRQPTQFGNHYKTIPFRVKGEFNCVSQLNTKQVSFYSSKPMQNSPYFQLLNHHRSKIENTEVEDLSVVERVLKSLRRKKRKIIKFIRRQ